VPTGPIYRVDQVFADPQVQHLGAAAPVRHRTLGEIRIVNQPVKLSRTPAVLATATPERGAHADEILRELGYADAEIAALRAKRVI
jgi:formyl-CoA transferase